MQISKRVSGIRPSMTLAVSAKAKAMKAAGVDVVGFGAGEPDFRTPAHICEAAVKAIHDGHHGYVVPSSGLPDLKAAVAAYLKRACGLSYEPAQVIIGCGGKHVLYEAFLAVLEPGDEAILPSPYWVSYPEMIRLADAKRGHPSRRRRAGLQDHAQATGRRHHPAGHASWSSTRPRTPRASSTRGQELAALAEVVAGKDLWVFSDEIYNELVYDGVDTCSFAAVRAGPHGPDRHVRRRVEDLGHDRLAHRLGRRAGRPHQGHGQPPGPVHLEPDLDQPVRRRRRRLRAGRAAGQDEGRVRPAPHLHG